jgi:carbonic anhydrase
MHAILKVTLALIALSAGAANAQTCSCMGINQSPVRIYSAKACDITVPGNKLWQANFPATRGAAIPVFYPELKTYVDGADTEYNINLTHRLTTPADKTQGIYFYNQGQNQDPYVLQNFHFHAPGEHQIDNEKTDAEVHFVFQNGKGAVVVFAFIYHIDPSSRPDDLFLAAQQPMANLLSGKLDSFTYNRLAAVIAEMFPNGKQYFSYAGSLTTAPFSEGVTFVVARKPRTITAAQLGLFKGLDYHGHPIGPARGRKDVGNRLVLHSR